VKGKRTNVANADCAIARAVHVIGDWWSILIIRDAFMGSQRFGEFQKSLGLAKNILSSRLKMLVQEEIFKSEPDPSQPSFNRYVLTDKGEQLYVVLIALWQWGETFCRKPFELSREMVDARDGHKFARMQPVGRDGRLIGPRDFKLGEIRRASPSRSKQGVAGSSVP
jgi:DNA-binding HxlR family transcriptional regulator